VIERAAEAAPLRSSSRDLLQYGRASPSYLFYDVAVSICSRCYMKCEAKIVFQDDKVYMLKHCMEHGRERVLMADDVDYYRRCARYSSSPRRCADVQHAGEVGMSVRLRVVHRP